VDVLGYTQRLGKTLILPLGISFVVFVLLRLGQIERFHLGFMADAGASVVPYLPILFALAISAGFSHDGSAVGAMAGALCFVILTAVTKAISHTIDLSILGGVIAGVAGAFIYNRLVSTPTNDMIKQISHHTLEENDENLDEVQVNSRYIDTPRLARQYMKALGGKSNVTTIHACITRLRLMVVNRNQVDEVALQQLGVKGVVKLGENHIQIIIGPLAELIGDEMQTIEIDDDLNDV
jgi:glucose-like phosphotransferase system IIB component